MIKERILKYLDFKGIAKEKFISEIGMTSANFRGKAKETPLNSNAIENILSICDDLNIEWLITGKGEMIKSDIKNIQSDNSVNETEVGYMASKRILKRNQVIPLYNITASAGIITLFSDSDRYIPIDYISIPNVPKADGALYVTGDSMYPLLKSGDIVIYKQYTPSIENIFWGEMYLISIDVDGDISTFVKWIHKSKLGDEYICLVSQNQHHQPKDIHISTIKALAIVKASIRINSMN